MSYDFTCEITYQRQNLIDWIVDHINTNPMVTVKCISNDFNVTINGEDYKEVGAVPFN